MLKKFKELIEVINQAYDHCQEEINHNKEMKQVIYH